MTAADIADAVGGSLIELRSTGGQTRVLPPVRTSGEAADAVGG
jgi:hypothetical protein